MTSRSLATDQKMCGAWNWGAANWDNGPAADHRELPPALRGTTGDPLYDRLTTLLRILAIRLHGFMFKTANLVNRTVWQELLEERTGRGPAPYQLVARFAANFGLAGWGAARDLAISAIKCRDRPEAEMGEAEKGMARRASCLKGKPCFTRHGPISPMGMASTF